MASKSFEGHTEWITSVSFSSDGKHIVSGSCDHTIQVWSVETGEMTSKPFKGPQIWSHLSLFHLMESTLSLGLMITQFKFGMWRLVRWLPSHLKGTWAMSPQSLSHLMESTLSLGPHIAQFVSGNWSLFKKHLSCSKG